MLTKLNETISLKDSQGNEYIFDMYLYDSIDDVEDAVKDFNYAGLYVFAKREVRNGKQFYNLSYIGETGDYSTRGYSNHHKRRSIERHHSNEFGICVLTTDDRNRLEIESELIDLYNPPCNG